MAEEFVGLEQGMHFLKIIISKVAFSHEVNTADVIVGQGDELVAEKDGVWVIVHVEVLYGQIIQFAKALVAEDRCFKCFELLEMMLRMATVIGL